MKYYLDCKICVTRTFHEKKWSMVFHRGVIQLAFLVSSCNRSNIDGHTIGLHITHYLQLPSLGTSTLLMAWFLMAMFGIGSLNMMFRQSSSVVGKTNISFSFHSFEVLSYFRWWKRHIKPLYFKTLLHENPEEFSLKGIVISWKFNLTKINLW